jgi:hypothetical protein
MQRQLKYLYGHNPTSLTLSPRQVQYLAERKVLGASLYVSVRGRSICGHRRRQTDLDLRVLFLAYRCFFTR